MKSPIRLPAFGLTFALLLAGCGAQDGATPLTTANESAPPPSNLTPEQKKAYDEAVKNSQPPSAGPTGR